MLSPGLTHLNAVDMLATICIVIQSSVCAGYARYLVNAEEKKAKGEQDATHLCPYRT